MTFGHATHYEYQTPGAAGKDNSQRILAQQEY